MKYFGTNLTEHGHYFWTVGETHLFERFIDMDKVPFYPYDLVRSLPNNGDHHFEVIGGYTVLAIKGSCKDERGGTCSVFYTEGTMTQDQMVECIMAIPICKRMISAMKFPVPIFMKE